MSCVKEVVEPMDLSIFEEQQDMQHDNYKCQDLESCICIKRILALLKYHELLHIESDGNDQSIFINFINTIYTSSDVIMDQFHLQKVQRIR